MTDRPCDWTKPETLMLIRLRTLHQKSFILTPQHSPIWAQIASQINHELNSERTGSQCRIRWKNLKARCTKGRRDFMFKEDMERFKRMEQECRQMGPALEKRRKRVREDSDPASILPSPEASPLKRSNMMVVPAKLPPSPLPSRGTSPIAANTRPSLPSLASLGHLNNLKNRPHRSNSFPTQPRNGQSFPTPPAGALYQMRPRSNSSSTGPYPAMNSVPLLMQPMGHEDPHLSDPQRNFSPGPTPIPRGYFSPKPMILSPSGSQKLMQPGLSLKRLPMPTSPGDRVPALLNPGRR